MNVSKIRRIARLAIPAALAIALAWTGSAEAASVFCEAVTTSSGVCEAQPQGAGFTYLWSTTGSAYLPTPSPDTAAVRQLRCFDFYQQNGSVQVTVVAPNGSRSTVSANICRAQFPVPILPF